MAQVVSIPHAIDEKGSYDDGINSSEPYTVPSLDVDISIKPEKAGRRNSVSAESYGQDDSDFEDDDDSKSNSQSPNPNLNSHSKFNINGTSNNNTSNNNNSKNNAKNSKNSNENTENNNNNNNNNNSDKNDSNTKKNGSISGISTNNNNNNKNNDRHIRKYKQKHFIRKVYPKTKGAIGRIYASVSDLFLWNGLDNEQQKLLIDAMFEKKVSKNESIITQGDRGDYFYVIESGFYEVWKSEKIKGSKIGVMSESKKVFEYDNKGSFGELALMYNSPRAATVKAKTEGILWAVDRKTFRHIIVGSTARKRHRYDKFLKKLAIFNKISDTTKSQIADILEGFDFKQGDVIIEQGSTNCRKFYLIQYGTANVVIQTNDGKTHIVSTLREGDFFGERGLLLNDVRSGSIIVTSKSFTCCGMDKASFIRLMDGLDEQFYVKMESYTYKDDLEDSPINGDTELADIGSDQDDQ